MIREATGVDTYMRVRRVTTDTSHLENQENQEREAESVQLIAYHRALRMRGLTLDAADVSREADEKHYLKRMKEIVEDFPNKGPPLLATRLAPHIYIGSQRNADDIPHLQRLGITHVLNCAGTRRFDLTRSPYPKDSGIKGYLLIPAEDHDEFNIRSYFPDAITFLDKCKHSSGRALVHCNLGVNRSGAISAAYLMVDQHMTLLEVMRYLKTKRSVVLYNKGFRRQLYRFAKYKGLLDPVINTGLTEESRPESSSRSKKSTSDSKNSLLSFSTRDRTSALPTGVSLDSATAGATGYTPSSSRPRKFGSRFFKRYGRSLSNSVVEEEIARHKPIVSSDTKDYGRSKPKDDPRESRFARSFLTLPRRSASSSNNNNNNKSTPQKMETLPENLPVQSFSDKSSAAHKRRAYRERGAAMDKNDDLVEKYQDTGFSTTLLPGAKLRASRTTNQVDGASQGMMAEPRAEDPGSPKSLSTSRPLRVYKRSATDSEVYRSRRHGTEQGADGSDAPKTPRSPGSENNLDKISKDLSAFTFQPDALPMRTRTASSPEHLMDNNQDTLQPFRGPLRPFSRKISAE